MQKAQDFSSFFFPGNLREKWREVLGKKEQTEQSLAMLMRDDGCDNFFVNFFFIIIINLEDIFSFLTWHK